MRELLITTGNKGKFPEITTKLAGIPFTFLNLTDIGCPPGFEIDEPGTTFEGNALIKAMTMGKRTGKLTLADDSGLCVDALDGRPGVYSARFVSGNDADRMRKVLEELQNVPDEKRTAHFSCVIAIYDPERNDKIRVCEGLCTGKILREPRGTSGFGYDPVFLSDDLGITLAEASIEQKNSISHRGRALAKAKEILLAEFA
jgi:XTP/dITP diphosphohydrolase